MLINEVSKVTKLTKKAIAYYEVQNLIFPSILENGYRDYKAEDVETLNKISILRKLNISVEEIKAILNDTTNSALQSVTLKKELEYQRNSIKKSILHKLNQGKPYNEIKIELQSVEQSQTITDKLLEAFPGCYGHFICMHFASFLKESIVTKLQQDAFETIVLFLDNVPALDMPKELENYWIDGTKHIGVEQICELLEMTKKVYEKPDEFLSDNKEMLDDYLKYKKSDEYRSSQAPKLMELMRQFNSTNGYNDVFIPAMKQLSSSYAKYCYRMEVANEKFLAQYPEIDNLNQNS